MSARTSPFASSVQAFEPKPKRQSRPTAADIDRTSQFPRREAREDNSRGKTVLGISCEPALADRFKTLCKRERYAYAAMLEILMDHHERR